MIGKRDELSKDPNSISLYVGDESYGKGRGEILSIVQCCSDSLVRWRNIWCGHRQITPVTCLKPNFTALSALLWSGMPAASEPESCTKSLGLFRLTERTYWRVMYVSAMHDAFYAWSINCSCTVGYVGRRGPFFGSSTSGLKINLHRYNNTWHTNNNTSS